MRSQFCIFGLEEMSTPKQDDEKTGQPLFFRKYPKHFDTYEEAREGLKTILEGKSPFTHFLFDHYSIMEVYLADKKVSG